MNPVNGIFMCDTAPIRACRICMITYGRLYELTPRLIEMLTEISDMLISTSDGLPQYICPYCHRNLQKYVDFKMKCRETNMFLLSRLLGSATTMEYIKNWNSTQHELSCTALESINIPSQETFCDIPDIKIKSELDDSEVKETIFCDNISIPIVPDNEISKPNIINDALIKTDTKRKDGIIELIVGGVKIVAKKVPPKQDPVILTETADNGLNDDHINEDDASFADKDNLPIILTKSALKTMSNAHVDQEYIKKYLDTNTRVNTDKCTELFFNYVRDKYIHKTKPQIDVGTIENENYKHLLFEDLEDEEKDNKYIDNKLSNLCKEKDEIKTMFYTYIKEKYVNKKEQRKVKKYKDVMNLKVRKLRRYIYKSDEDIVEAAKKYNCSLKMLTKEEQVLEVEKRKGNKKYFNATYKCEMCYQGFKFEAKYKTHMVLHDISSGNYLCEICHIRFRTRTLLRRHLLKHKLKFICKLCNSVTRRSCSAKEHSKFHEGTKYVCEHCDKVFSKYATRINHIRIHHGTVECDICYVTFVGRMGVMAHKTKAHVHVYKCDICETPFNDARAITHHLSTSPGGVCDANMIPCRRCGENFVSEDLLADHKVNQHKSRQVRDYTYLASKNGANKKCDSEVEDQTTDNKMAADKQKFLCEMCAFSTYAGEASLRYHQRIHTGEKPYQCPTCPKRFRLGIQLQIHVRCHTGERPYKCKLCPKAFKSRPAIVRHELVHTKVRRYKCNFCQKSFLTSTCIKMHIRTVHMKVPTPPRIRRRK